ncbi:hypothetical protein VTL71DRAFT_6251 [Oculimacula yallundae]|uniref:Secreted protein n=1 Tax=Oculimacula yallundae TaxID=86028 RepID=A0ABR4BZV3_9HELO
MLLKTSVYSAAALFAILPTLTSAAGFHLVNRFVAWTTVECNDCPKKQQCCGNIANSQKDLIFLPSKSYNCETLNSAKYELGPDSTDQIGHGTRFSNKGATCNHDLVFYPKNNGQALEVWENAGKYYGDCYKQSANAKLSCDSGAPCGRLAGAATNNCHSTGTDVWVCPVNICA